MGILKYMFFVYIRRLHTSWTGLTHVRLSELAYTFSLLKETMVCSLRNPCEKSIKLSLHCGHIDICLFTGVPLSYQEYGLLSPLKGIPNLSKMENMN